jgi:hypothetical protein
MSRSTGSNTSLRLALALLLCVAGAVHARPLPTLPFEPVAVGAGTLRFLGLHLYDGRLWSPDGRWRADAPFALELIYARGFEGEDIARRSIDEIRRLGGHDADTLARWEARLRGLFPDVRAGDRLTGVRLPGAGVRFYAGARHLGEIRDETFANAFFGIWLDARTRAPDLRKKLLGLQ